jgi:Tfp pilus assembly protein PilX
MKKTLRIVLACLVVPALVFATIGCASNKRVTALEDQVKMANQKADTALANGKECCDKADAAVQAAKDAADRADAAAARAESAADKTEAIFNKKMNK